MDHRDSVLNGHLARFALHAGDGGQPLPQTRGPGARGVVLPGLPTDSRAPEGIRTEDVAAPASPKEVMRSRILLVPVNVPHFDSAGCPAEYADSRARRRAGVRPVAEDAVSYLPRSLAPVSPARPGCYSPSSSSSSSSSSLSASPSASSSPLRMSSASPTAVASSSLVLSGVYASFSTAAA
jgi:hypothetical protein